MITQNPEFLHYKNAIYQGFMLNGRRQGPGILILDTSAVIVGSYKSDQIVNTCLIWIDHQTYFIGQFRKGLFDGPFVIRSPHLIIYSSMAGNVICTDILVINRREGKAKLWNIESDQGFCSRQLQIGIYDLQANIIKSIAPYIEVIPTCIDFLKKQFSQYLNIKSYNKKQTFISIKSNNNRNVTLKIGNQQLISFGVYEEGNLSGLGFIREQSAYFEGQFTNSKLNGEGVKGDFKSEKILYGTFKMGDIRNIQTVSDDKQKIEVLLLRLKKKIHIHSLQFINTYVNQRPIILIKDLLRLFQEQDQSQSENFGSRVIVGSWRKYHTNPQRQQKIGDLAYNLAEYNAINTTLKYRK